MPTKKSTKVVPVDEEPTRLVSGTTSSGFEFTVDFALFDDMEIVDLIADADKGDLSAISLLCKKVLSEETRTALYEHCRNKKGIVPVSKITTELAEIMTAGGNTGKN